MPPNRKRMGIGCAMVVGIMAAFWIIGFVTLIQLLAQLF